MVGVGGAVAVEGVVGECESFDECFDFFGEDAFACDGEGLDVIGFEEA